MPEDTHSTDETAEANGVVMDESEATANFLEDRDPAEYPSVLRITSNSEEKHRSDALDRLQRWEDGKTVPHVINFQNPSDLRTLLTDRRLELLRSVMAERPSSIRGLADRLDRDVKSVHEDLRILADYDIVHFQPNGRAKQPFVPYETIEISLEISAPGNVDDPATA